GLVHRKRCGGDRVQDGGGPVPEALAGMRWGEVGRIPYAISGPSTAERRDNGRPFGIAIPPSTERLYHQLMCYSLWRPRSRGRCLPAGPGRGWRNQQSNSVRELGVEFGQREAPARLLRKQLAPLAQLLRGLQVIPLPPQGEAQGAVGRGLVGTQSHRRAAL